jgi:hypothetical protein
MRTAEINAIACMKWIKKSEVRTTTSGSADLVFFS